MNLSASFWSCLALGSLLLLLEQVLGAPRALAAPNQEVCLLPPEEGPCRALIPRWYYNRYTQTCQEFTYGGCEGNANNFRSLESCEKSCWMIRKVPKICRLEADPGPCRGYLKRYSFNLSSMKCEKFIYGGCYGNDNHFQDEDSCVDYCLPQKTGPSLCYSPKDEGSCSASVTRYYYNSKSQSCEEFSYTGCGGNANNFVNEKDCYSICKKAGSKKSSFKKSRNKLPKTMRKLQEKNLINVLNLKSPSMLNALL
ncbi:tissue factor pathway inhibitor 2 isoform X1 [Malaclemys terrapin pileata]|uniref:tissue factor pathway inhibitor 2 isoform X1 n=1 Tax=Malaclemys terrapin pileata TaxID=2991368 RepID=UPI0023A7CE40|nr:tissue factor pathway inhibitor 2 isoform X1 [Malaclemys terrapin pileata]